MASVGRSDVPPGSIAMNLAADADTPLSLYQLMDPDVLADPYALYRSLREHDPVFWDPYLHVWVVTGYAEAVTVLQRFRSARIPDPQRVADLGMRHLGPIYAHQAQQMIFRDPPVHGPTRRLAAHAFTPRRIARLRDRVETITRQLLDAVDSAAGFDLVAALAEPLPGVVTTELLGMPQTDRTMLHAWSNDVAEMLGTFSHSRRRSAELIETIDAAAEYFRAAIRREARVPTEGLVNAMAAAGVAEGGLEEEEIVSNAILILAAGLETTTNLIGLSVLTLLRQPQHLQQLRADPDLIPSAIEELLRYESPTQQTGRLAPAAVALGGHEIPEGDGVTILLGAANRDPAQFSDPDELDLRRRDNRHIAFGWGPHFCFGAPLARLEGQIALGALLDRFPDLQLDPAEPVRWRPNSTLRGPASLQLHCS